MTEQLNADGTPIINNGQPPVVPGTTPPSGGTPPVEDETWWKEASAKHNFTSKEQMWKSYQEAEKKISEDGDKLKDFQDFQNKVAPVLDIVINDKELLSKVRVKMGLPPEEDTPAKPDASIDKPVAPTVDTETRKYITDSILHSFEESHGISKLDEATQKEIKAKIGLELKKFTNGKDFNLNQLPTQMDDAFKLVMSKDEKLRNIFEPKDDNYGDYGSLPSQSSGIDKDGQIKLTPEELKVADNMPGGKEAYIEGKKKVLGK